MASSRKTNAAATSGSKASARKPSSAKTSASKAKTSVKKAKAPTPPASTLALRDCKTVFQFIPLQVSDGSRKAVLSLTQSGELKQFIATPDTAAAINTEDRSIGTLPLDALSRDDVIVPSTAAPISVNLSIPDFVRLTSERRIQAMDREWAVQLNPQALSRLLAGRTDVVLATDGQNIALLRMRIVKHARGETAPLPAIDEILVRRSDLPRFLDDPMIPGTRKKPYRVELTKHQATDFLEYGAVTMDVGEGRTLSLVVAPDDVTEVQSGLSFRRDIWSPLRTTRTLGVMSRGDLASAKAIKEAAKEDFDVLLDRMSASLGYESGTNLASDEQQVGLIIPWSHSVEIEDQLMGRREATMTLLPGEVRHTKTSDRSELPGGSNDTNGQTRIAASLTVNVGGDALEVENLDRSTQEFARSLIEEFENSATAASGQSQASLPGSVGAQGKSTFSNPSKSALMQIDSFRAFNAATVSASADMQNAQLGVFLPNPFLSLTFDTDTILRYGAILRDNLIDERLRPGFQALGGLSARREVIRPKAQPTVLPKPTDNKDKSKSAPEPAEAKVSTAAKDREAQITRLLAQARASLGRVQDLAGKILDPDHQAGAMRAFATMGNRNAADVLNVPFGSARSEDVFAARKWLASRVLVRRFQSIQASLSDLVGADLSSDAAVYEWGERLMSAVPTPMKMFELVNISNESIGIIREILRPLVQTITVSNTDMESWWQRLAMVGLLSPEDLGLTRALERMISNYIVVLDVDAERIEGGVADQNDLRLARELLRHIRDNGEHYAGVVFENQPKRTQVSLMQSIAGRIASDVPSQAFDFDRMWVVGQNIVLGLNEAGFSSASQMLSGIQSMTQDLQESRSVIPVQGLTYRSMFVDIPETEG